MASLKENNLSSSAEILKRQKGKPIIYVEGESDKKIFENYWFVDYLEKVSFSIVQQTQGCGAVVQRVAADRTVGIDAFGIVDRDKLMGDRNWTLLRETDDGIFESSPPYPKIKVTLRWELESYLIDPVAVESYLAPACGGRAERPIAEVIDELLNHADALVLHAALNQSFHMNGKKAPGDGFTNLDDRSVVDERIVNNIFPTASAQLVADFKSSVPAIDAFAGPAGTSPRQRLDGLLRIINGKAMLERIKKSGNITHDITYLIAKEVKRSGAIPIELLTFVQSCCT